MATVRKIILSPGVYHAPQGRLHATPERVKRWADTFRRMKANGIRVPVCWGHQPGAIPGDGQDKAGRQYELSRFNAGYVTNMQRTADGDLEGELDIPGAEVDEDGNLVTWAKMPDGRKVRCAIKEVSAAIRDWQDGSGRQWPDAIMHVALVPLPVVAGQEGFEASLATESEPGEIHLSLSAYLGGEDEEETMPMIEEDVVETPDVGMDPMSETLQVLSEFGLHLPGDTNDGNLSERLRLVGGALIKAGVVGGVNGGGHDGPDGDEMPGEMDMAEDEGDLDNEMPPEDDMDEEMLDEGDELPLEGEEPDGDEFDDDEEGLLGLDEEEEDGETEISGDSDGLPGEKDEDEEDATEEPRPIMMSTTSGGRPRGLVARTKMEKMFLNQVKRGVQKQRLARVDTLVRKGMPRHRAEQLRQAIINTPVELGTREGKIVPLTSAVDIELSTLESVSGEGWAGSTARGGKVKRAKRPEVRADKVSQKFIDEMAATVSQPSRTRK